MNDDDNSSSALSLHSGVGNSYPFTYFGSPDRQKADTETFLSLESGRCKRGAMQFEICPITHKFHMQAWVWMRRASRVDAVRKYLQQFFPGCHVGIADKPPLANWRYCVMDSKRIPDTEPSVFGKIPPGAGSRTDLESVCKEFEAHGYDLNWLDQTYPHFAVARPGFAGLSARQRPTPKERVFPEVLVFWGVSGSGKSHEADRIMPDAQVWTMPTNGNLYAAGYRGQSDHNFQDFAGWAPFRWLVAFLDKYPMSVNTRQSMIQCSRKRIVFTSQYHPRDWYAELEEKHPGKIWPALRRRIKKIVHFPFAYKETHEGTPEEEVHGTPLHVTLPTVDSMEYSHGMWQERMWQRGALAQDD